MADIDVVPKRKTHLWVWIAVALAVMLVLWLLLGSSNTPREVRGAHLDLNPYATLMGPAT